ncbi:MAG: ABC transporter substrate-binding protein [Geodermatophilaceae bacterium]
MQRRRTVGRLAVAVVLLLLTGCTGTVTESLSASVPSGAAADRGVTEERSPSQSVGGTLRIVAGAPDSLDPARSYFPWVWNIMRLYARTLVTYAAEPGAAGSEPVPDLATDLGVPSDGGQTWTYSLKPDQHFEDGSVITAADVKYGIERSFAADVVVGGPTYVVDLLDDPANPYGGPYTDPHPQRLGLARVETPDARTLVFRLNRPYADFDHIMALPSSSPVPRAADTGADYGADPVSSGPYAVTAVDEVLGITLERNPRWDRDADPVRTALPDRVEIRTGLTGPDRDQRVIGGSADLDVMSTGVQPETLLRIDADDGLQTRTDRTTSGTIRMLALPVTVPPMDNVHCRRAVSLAVDRPALVEALGGGQWVTPAVSLGPQTLPGSAAEPGSDDTPATEPVLAEAQAELAACGRPEGFSVRIATPNDQRPLQVARSLADDLARIGVEGLVVGLDPETYYSSDIGRPDNVTAEQYGILVTAWSGDLPTPATYYPPLVSAVQPTGSANYAQIGGPDLLALVTAALTAADPGVAEGTWQMLDETLVELSAYVPLVEDRVVLLAGERLRNAYVHRAYGGYDLAVVGVR